MKKFIWILIICLSLINKGAKAMQYSTPVSCNGAASMMSSFAASMLSFGMFSVYQSLFNMVDAENSNRPATGTDPAGCAKSSPDVWFTFTYLDPLSSPPFETVTHDYNFSHGSSKFWLFPPASAIGANEADQICVEFFTVGFGYQIMGCKYRVDASTTTGKGAACFLGQSCGKTGVAYSKFPLPIAAQVVQCTFETLSNIFSNATCTTSGSASINTFLSFQNTMRDIVRSALIIYVALFGAKIALGAEIPSHGEVYMFFFKLLMVIYFSVGFTNGKNAVTQYMLPITQSLPGNFADLIFRAGGASGLCEFDPTTYTAPYNYLALFDAIDCRVANYLGMEFATNPSGLGLQITSVRFWYIIIPIFFGFQIPFMICCIIFALYLISISVFFTHCYVIALILIAILVYLAPLFVPFALFGVTKGYFDAWLRLLLAYIFQPMILAAFIALMFSVYDSLMYGTCTFSVSNGIYSMNTSSDPSCYNSFGYMFGGFSKNGSIITTVKTFFFDLPTITPEVVAQLFVSLLMLALFAILFDSVIKQISYFAGDLTGGNAIGQHAISPTFVISKAKEAAGRAYHAAKAVVEAKAGNKQAALKDAQQAIKPSDSKDGDSGASVSKASPQDSQGKDSLGKDSLGKGDKTPQLPKMPGGKI